jgi:hypothetical protein
MPKKQSDVQPAPPQPRLNYIKPDNLFTTYANNVAYSITPIDFTFVFGQVVEGNEQQINIEQRARVTVSPIQAKLLMIMLHAQIEAFEAANGEIRIPNQVNQSVRKDITLEPHEG